MLTFPIILIGVLLALVLAGFRVLAEYERGVIFRLGRFNGVKTAGLKWIIPGVDRMVRISLREIVMDVPPQEVITRDNVSVKVNAVLYFRVLHPEKAVIQVENYLYGTSQMAQTTLRSVCGQAELDELLSERERINQQLQEIIDLQTEPWGVKVRAVELKQIDLPSEMQRAMARQAEAEREKRSKVIHSEGEFQAAQRLADAARVMSAEPAALQLRYLQTLADIATENNSTTIFPIPIDILRPFYDQMRADEGRKRGEGTGWWREIPEEEPRGSDQRIRSQVGRMIANWLAVGISLAVIGGWAYTGLYQLTPGEAGVILRVGKYNRTVTEPGLKLALAGSHRGGAQGQDSEIRREKFGLSEGKDRMQPSEESGGFENAIQTADSNIVNLSYEVQYSIDNPFSFLYTMAAPQQTLRDAAQAAVREVVGRTGVDGVLYEERGRIQSEAREILQATLEGYFSQLDQQSAFGIGLINLNIVQPPPPVQEAFDDVVAAKQDGERAISQARGDAREIRERAGAKATELREAATAYKESKILEARGEAQRFVALQVEYALAPEVTRRRLYLETMEQVLPDVEKVIVDPDTVNLLPFFPLQGRAPVSAAQGEEKR